MNKFVTSVGLLALGAASAKALDVPGQTPTMVKPWSVSASLRGFYDDNFNTVPNDVSGRKSAYGFEVSPNLTWQWTSPQTKASFAYVYDFKYYDHRPAGIPQHTV